MNTPDPAPEHEPGSAPEHEPAPEHVPVVHETEREVTITRSVRYGRVIAGMTVLGILVAVVASLVFPLDPEAQYTLAQITGFMALIGAAIGLALGCLLALILGVTARRKRGTAIAIHSDVQ
ncbi:hypothetical protein [Leucobacter luti]|uniref:hypothetical protein n=1 Tax=Leucobacter luti TaxID=340320 RepID=UPI003D092638